MKAASDETEQSLDGGLEIIGARSGGDGLELRFGLREQRVVVVDARQRRVSNHRSRHEVWCDRPPRRSWIRSNRGEHPSGLVEPFAVKVGARDLIRAFSLLERGAPRGRLRNVRVLL